MRGDQRTWHRPVLGLAGALARREAPPAIEAALIPVVRRHGLAPLAASAGIRVFRDDLVRAAITWEQLRSTVPPVVASLVEEGIGVVPIKGLAYATTLYADPAERPMTDVDLLVPAARHRDAERVLAAIGFARYPGPRLHHASTWLRDGMAIDLHHSIISPLRARLDLDAVWARTGEAVWPPGARQLDPADALLFQLVHMARNHLWSPLIHVVDAARLRERLGDAGVAEMQARARAAGLGRGVARALRLCRDVAATEPPARPGGWPAVTAEELAVLHRPGFAQRVAFDLITAGTPWRVATRVVTYVASRLTAK